MAAGRLQERVLFQSPAPISDGQGGQEEGWSQGFECSANFMYLRGGETVQAARLEGRQPVVVTIRQSSLSRSINPEWRMVDARRGDIYNIRSIVPSDNRLYLELTCEKGVAV
jgi:SPP1 family predicted phage head-tail adaptor